MEEVCAGLIKDEYFALLEIVAQFDDRFLTLKGWSVTFSLATLALAFQKNAKGLFFVAALSAASFWMLEGYLKVHQTRYYPRMRQIEVVCHAEGWSAPAVDWAWEEGGKVMSGDADSLTAPKAEARDRPWTVRVFGLHLGSLLFPHVFLPHAVTILIAVTVLIRCRFTQAGGRETPLPP